MLPLLPNRKLISATIESPTWVAALKPGNCGVRSRRIDVAALATGARFAAGAESLIVPAGTMTCSWELGGFPDPSLPSHPARLNHNEADNAARTAPGVLFFLNTFVKSTRFRQEK